MGRRLAAAVHVTHPVTHEPMILQPGDEPDEALVEVITNPAAWEPDDDEGEDGEDGDGGDPDAGAGDPGAQAEGEAKPRSRARKPADE